MAMKQHFRFATLNTENLFLHFLKDAEIDIHQCSEKEWQKTSARPFGHKPLKKCLHLASMMLAQQVDIWGLTEVGGEESLAAFNKLFLEDKFEVICPPSNSDRGIDLGFLIKKNSFHYSLTTNIHQLVESPDPNIHQTPLSRDILLLRLHLKDRPDFHLFLVHLKSYLDKEGLDPWGMGRRLAEVKLLVELIKEIDPQLPIVVAGDFNGMAQKEKISQEFNPIYQDTDLDDVLSILKIPVSDRVTHHHIVSKNNVLRNQLDYLFLNPAAIKHFSGKGGVIPYLDSKMIPLPWPNTMEEKWQFPSDHYALFADFILSEE
jgi:hypothetical protein